MLPPLPCVRSEKKRGNNRTAGTPGKRPTASRRPQRARTTTTSGRRNRAHPHGNGGMREGGHAPRERGKKRTTPNGSQWCSGNNLLHLRLFRGCPSNVCVNLTHQAPCSSLVPLFAFTSHARRKAFVRGCPWHHEMRSSCVHRPFPRGTCAIPLVGARCLLVTLLHTFVVYFLLCLTTLERVSCAVPTVRARCRVLACVCACDDE